MDDSKSATTFGTWSFDEPCKNLSSLNDLGGTSLSGDRDAAKNEDAGADYDLVFVSHYSVESDGDDATGKSVLEGDFTKELDKLLNGALYNTLDEEREDYKDGSKAGSTTRTIRIVDATGKSTRYVLVGLGSKPDESNGDNKKVTGFTLGKAIATKCIEEGSLQVQNAVVLFPRGVLSPSFYRDLSSSFYSSLYADNRFRGSLQSIKKAKKSAHHLRSLTVKFYGETDEAPAALSFDPKDAIDEGMSIARGVHMAKDIVNAPHNVLNSLSLANLARSIAEESDCLTCTILDKDECEKRGMGAYLGVARASETPPQFIHMTYTPPKDSTTVGANKVIGVVGKGLLFDTGGYNIKVAMMELMKFDCGGAAAVLGAAKTIGAVKPPGVECHFVVAACENMVNDRGIVPSDVLVASNGVSIEVLNTDAEGRLTLADALVYCDKELECEKIIELSTLTGACMRALGKEVCGIFTENDDLAKELEVVSEVTGEQSWRLPLVKSYERQLESKIADISNCGTAFGGAITAGLFLNHFVDTKKVPFAHIDIAGPVWDTTTGATGFGSKLVTEWIRSQGR
mmetsp:Transcript_4796/g.10728  ORF Transcript_4796/g.10728 Transcript_4796/m.10728 type:complete len:570 (-) Transcript_4796:291-2000(-)